MTKHTQSIQAFTALGDLLNDYTSKKTRNDDWIEKLDNALVSASSQNKWFTKENALRNSVSLFDKEAILSLEK